MYGNINKHPTKKGPGRRHGQGTPHGRRPRSQSGAAAEFVLHRNPERALRRLLISKVGRRQFKRATARSS